jgi:regulatory protein YycI of two-component signal transduction system YycFG
MLIINIFLGYILFDMKLLTDTYDQKLKSCKGSSSLEPEVELADNHHNSSYLQDK